MRIGIIYKVTSPSKKSYFGRSINPLSKRKYHHLTSARNGSELYFHRAIRKYGGCNFTWEIIEKIKNEDKEDLINILNEKEIGYIKKYNTLSPNGYNLTKGGGNYGGNGETLGRKQPLDEIRRRAESNRGKKRTEIRQEILY